MSMQSRSDLELLGEYARTGAQDAFAALVHRHVDLVYTAAQRQVRDPHLAEDVTQAVFLVLASKAGPVGPKVVLQGWLLNATRFAACDALRRGARRQRHENLAAQQRSPQVQRGEPSSFSAAEQREDLERLDAILDAALTRLGTAGRDAVVLRYFQDKSFRDIGQELGIGEDAAKQRVSRALRQLRRILAQSGLELPLEGLGAALAARGILPAPPGLALAIIAAGGKAALAAGGSASLAKGAMTLMAWTKAKIVAATAAGLLLLSSGAVVVHHYATSGERVVVLKPDAPLPAGTTAQPTPVPVSWGIGPTQPQSIPYKGPPITGTVLDPAGSPLAGAEVLISSANSPVNVYPTRQVTGMRPGPKTTTGRDGHFELMPTDTPSAVVVRAAAGYAASVIADTTKSMSITIQPWARLEGVVRRGSKPVPRARVQVAQYGDEVEWNRWHIVKQQELTCDDNGHFVMDRVVAGHQVIGRIMPRSPMPLRSYSMDLPAGKTTFLNIGGDGRTIVGHLPRAAQAFSSRNGTMQQAQPKMLQPADWDKLDESERQKLQQQFWNSPEFKAWQQNAVIAQFDIGKDGTFRVEDVPAGNCEVNVQVGDGQYYIETAGWGSTPVTVPPASSAQIDVPLDIGEVHVTLEKRLGVGEAGPDITGDGLDGSSARLSGHRGKYVLLYLWQSDRRDLMDKLGMLRALDDRFGDDPRFTIVGVNVDPSRDTARKTAFDEHMRWPQILVHGWEERRLPRVYTLSPAMLFLLDPDGRLVAKNTDVPGVFGVLERLLPARQGPNIQVDRQPPGKEGQWTVTSGADNVARHAAFSLVDGQLYNGSGPLDRLHDGALPGNADAPGQCLFFAMGTLEGRFKVGLGSTTPIAQINTYSWHKSDRGPQVYKLYAATGDERGFDSSPKIGTDPATSGWKQIAVVDTLPPAKPVGGRYTVHLADPSGSLGNYRYLLFETFVTETADTWGHTFYAEIEVIRGTPTPTATANRRSTDTR
jgi:RNA polymerase sigma factor (sigma-70 family)